jgi:2-oxoglutarate dehydrogenase E2 component (dihydrolipoamide succinyltransferase)
MSVVEMKVPTIGESITEVTLSEWLKADGDYVNLDEPICEFESDKATLEFPAEASGILRHVAAEGDDLEIGALVAKIDASAAKPDAAATVESASDAKTSNDETTVTEISNAAKPESDKSGDSGSDGPGKQMNHPSPAAAKILRENDLTAANVNGSGKDGRVTKEDAVKAAQNKSTATTAAPSKTSDGSKSEAESTPANATVAAFSRGERREKMSRMRRTIAKRLVSAKNNTAMLTTFNEVDLTNVMALRKTHQEAFVKKYGVKLGFMSLFAKACSKALLELPAVNAFIDGDHFIFHDYTDISIAISTPTGLVVPPIKNVESLGFHEIELKIKELAEKARNGKLTLEEMQGGTFTITNGGVFGSMMSTPILNEPQSAILGMHNIQQRPVAINGQVEIRPMMYLALSYDHRVIDGSTSVTFLVKVKEMLEDPVRMLISV